MRVGVVQPQVKPTQPNQLHVQPISKEAEIVPVKPVPPRPPREPAVEARLNPAPQTALDPWRLFPEQKRYYLEEFSKLQKEEGGLLAGLIAREFFLKSKLSREELMLIWEMADLDQDGKLTKLEFCLAFHLTNVRRNGFPLPHAVPESLFISLADLQEAQIEGASISSEHPEGADPNRYDDDNWETFSEKSFSTVSSASTLPNFAVRMRDSDSICQPVPMRMTPSSLAERNRDPRRRDEIEKIGSPPSKNSLEAKMEAKRELYLQYPNRVRDGSSSAQSTSSSSPVSDRSLNLRGDSSDEYSSTKPLHHSSESDSDSPIDDSATNSTQENFADFRNFEKIVTSTERLEIKSAHSSPNQVENIEATKIDQPKSKSLPREALAPEKFEKKEVEAVADRKLDQVRGMVASLKERNGRLARLNQALSLELKDLISERVSLETRIEL